MCGLDFEYHGDLALSFHGHMVKGQGHIFCSSSDMNCVIAEAD